MTLLAPSPAAKRLDTSDSLSCEKRLSPPLCIGPDTCLSAENVERWAESAYPDARLSQTARIAMDASVKRLEVLRECETPMYGVTTGFGPFVRFDSAEGGSENHGAGLIAHLGAGWGPDAPPVVVWAAQLIRAQSLAQGYSGVAPALLEAYLELPRRGIAACVPQIGSVGASGDLIPLAHIARVLTGDGAVYLAGERVAAQTALVQTGLAPRALSGREALSLTNGTSFLTAYAALAISRSARLLRRAEQITGWAYRLLGARSAALDARLHRARGHKGQAQSARNIRLEAARFGPEWEDATRPLQEIYSLRCAPQVLGACRENLDFARRLVECEINGVSDNPLLVPGPSDDAPPECLHGGNFHGQQVAFASDALNAALTQAAVLAERQIDLLVTPGTTNEHAPLLLSWEPGPYSGVAGAQITATALVAEMRAHAQPHATFSIPTNAGNQDVVSMGTLAARQAFEQTERFAAVLSVLALTLAQLDFLRRESRASGRPSPVPPGLLPPNGFTGLRADRPLQSDIAHIAGHLLRVSD